MNSKMAVDEGEESVAKESNLVDRIVTAYPVVFAIAAVVATIVQVYFFGRPVVESALLGFLVFPVGFQGLWAFLGHYFRSDEVAASIGWPPGNPFQKEIAFTNLSFGILGVLCIWFHDEFWLATGIGKAVFVLGAQTVHVREARAHGNRRPGNRGRFVLTNVVVQATIIVLLALYFS